MSITKRKIYVASSWRNDDQQTVVKLLRDLGHEVYDFKNPDEGGGFHWSDIDPNWKSWTPEEFVKHLDNPIAMDGFSRDYNAMHWADTFVLVQPCGRSSHLELGWAAGKEGKLATMLLHPGMEPELMIGMCDAIFTSFDHMIEFFTIKEEVEYRADQTD